MQSPLLTRKQQKATNAPAQQSVFRERTGTPTASSLPDKARRQSTPLLHKIPVHHPTGHRRHGAIASHRTLADHATRTDAVQAPTGIAATDLQPNNRATGVSQPSEETIGQSLSPVQPGSGEEERPLRARSAPLRRQDPEDKEPQTKETPAPQAQLQPEPVPRSNDTGIPDNLKAGIESLSGISLDNVKVHYNSAQPAQLNALAHTQGSDIHVAPGQEQHLPHEAWHVVQQTQGRVKPTMQMKHGVRGNDDAGLEHEADVMGARALAPAGQQPADDSRRLSAAGRIPAAQVPSATGGNIQLKKSSLRARIEEKLRNRVELDARDRRFLAREATRARARKLPRPDAKALQSEILKRDIRRQEQAASVAKTIREGKRPERPNTLAARGHVPGIEGQQDLTAHHLVPYNFIRDSFASAVEGQDLTAMQNLLAFSGQGSTDSSEAFRALAYQAEHKPKPKAKTKLTREEGLARRAAAEEERRLGIAPFHMQEPPESSKSGLQQLFKQATWASHNVFMGPAPEHRTDDPKEGLDAQYLRSGALTKSSVMAKEIHHKGFAGIDPVDFAPRVQSARNQADGLAKRKTGEASTYGDAFEPRASMTGTRVYDPLAWEKVAKGKVRQVGAVKARDQAIDALIERARRVAPHEQQEDATDW